MRKASRKTAVVRSVVAPGADWLYLKLYGTQGGVDDLLLRLLRPLIRELRDAALLREWFFVRFADPDWHIRVRCTGTHPEFFSRSARLAAAATSDCVADGRLWRVQMDTYERAVTRYGGEEAMMLSESVFGCDSDAVVDALAQLEDPRSMRLRSLLTLRGMDDILAAMGLDVQERHDLVSRRSKTLSGQFANAATAATVLGINYRSERRAIDSVLFDRGTEDTALAGALQVFQCRRERLAPLMMRLAELRDSSRLQADWEGLAADYLHMHVNRVLAGAHRAQEWALCECLRRAYRTQSALAD